MNSDNENIVASAFIQKFKGKFNNTAGGCSVIPNSTISSLSDIGNLAVYTYLASKPSSWHINPKELSSHFKVGIKKIYKILSDLMLIGLMERKEIRQSGKFVTYEYYLYLTPVNSNSPNGQNGRMVSPNGQKPPGGEPNGQNGCTYKTKKTSLQKKESRKKDFSLEFLSRENRKNLINLVPSANQRQKQIIDFLMKNPDLMPTREERKELEELA